jgi:outer membrane protein OmpA-like peptidoglycan-associated protein
MLLSCNLEGNMHFNRRNNRRAPPAGKKDHWAVAYAKANPLKVGTAAATLYGMIIILSYHAYIEYDAAFDIRALASLVLAAAYVGFLVLSGLSACLFTPAYFIGAFCIDDQSRRTQQDLYGRIATCFFIAFCVFVIMFGLVCLYGDREWTAPLIFLAPFVVYGAYALWKAPRRQLALALRSRHNIARGTDGWISWHLKRGTEILRNTPADYRTKLQFGLAMAAVALIEVFPLEIVFIMARDSHLMQAEHLRLLDVVPPVLVVGLIIHATGVYLVSAWRNPEMARKHRLFSIMAALFVPIFAPMSVSEPTPVFALTMMLTKTGDFRAAEMTLNDDGCRVAESLDRTLCVKTREGTNKLCNVHVMSRIGAENYVLLAYPAPAGAIKDTGQRGQRPEKIGNMIVQPVYIPAKDILGTKPDLSVRVFTKEVIKKHLVRTSSICELPKPEEPKPATSASFAEKDLFEFDDHSLTAEGKETLGAFARRLVRENQGALSVDVTGHADQLGSPYHNLSLSQLRAITVANFLQSQLDGKVRTVKMSMQGVGSSRVEVPDAACPVSMKRAERIACFARNRRVDIVVTRL